MSQVAVIELASPPEAPALVEPILRSVPEWFGIESATRAYIEAAGAMPTWVARAGGAVVGFATIREHNARAAEIHCIAVRQDWHGRGVGTAMVGRVEAWLKGRGVEYLQVKTMGPSRPSREYALTARFYERVGFVPLEELLGFWNGLPALVLVKRL